MHEEKTCILLLTGINIKELGPYFKTAILSFMLIEVFYSSTSIISA